MKKQDKINTINKAIDHLNNELSINYFLCNIMEGYIFPELQKSIDKHLKLTGTEFAIQATNNLEYIKKIQQS